MRQLLHFCFLFSLGTAAFAADRDSDSGSDSIRRLLQTQVEAWNQGDIDRFMIGYAPSPETTYVSGDEVTRGWQTVRDRYAKKYRDREQMGKLTFSELTILPISHDAAMVLGSWRLQRRNDAPHGKFTLLFRKLPNGWRIVLDHTSAAEPRS